MKKVLVTGGGGFLGSAIARLLVNQNIQVYSLSRRRYPSLTALGVEQIEGDISDFNAVSKACNGVDTIFHTAAKAGIWGKFDQYYQTNVIGTEHILSACKALPHVNLIYTSSPSVVFEGGDMEGVDESAPYPKSFNAAYPKTKAMAEQKVISACKKGLSAIILRPHLIWGPGDNHLIPRILARAHRLRRIGGGANKVDTIYIDNAARAHLLAQAALAKDPSLSGRVYFISQDSPIALWEMVNRILAAGGKPPITRTISCRKALLIGTVLESIYRTFGLKSEPPMTRFLAHELSTAHWFNIDAAKRDLGYLPEISIDEGLERLRAWLSKHPYYDQSGGRS